MLPSLGLRIRQEGSSKGMDFVNDGQRNDRKQGQLRHIKIAGNRLNPADILKRTKDVGKQPEKLVWIAIVRFD